MSDLTTVLFTIGLVLLSTGLVMRWQDRGANKSTDAGMIDD